MKKSLKPLKANAHDFLLWITEEVTTRIVDNVRVKLSGGQKQRISIARNIAKESTNSYFDEAISALDNESESIVQNL